MSMTELPRSGSASLRLRRMLPAPAFSGLRWLWRHLERLQIHGQLLRDVVDDARRFARWSHSGKNDRTLRQHEAALLKAYHSIEKGLSLAQPRPGFGEAKVRDVTARIDAWLRVAPAGNLVRAAADSVRAYQAFNRRHGISMPWLDAWLERAGTLPGLEGPGAGGTSLLPRSAVLADATGTGPAFFESRHSIRNFAPGTIPGHDIEAAVRIAQKAPSVCNRQGARVYCFNMARQALEWQPGNSGFGHLAAAGLIVTCDLQAFSSVGERHQAYVDGGLFAMSLVYGLHSLGYGTCMLAWSQRAARERQLRRALQIPDQEVVIMMIAVGHLPETLEVACSQRRPLEDVLVMR